MTETEAWMRQYKHRFYDEKSKHYNTALMVMRAIELFQKKRDDETFLFYQKMAQRVCGGAI